MPKFVFLFNGHVHTRHVYIRGNASPLQEKLGVSILVHHLLQFSSYCLMYISMYAEPLGFADENGAMLANLSFVEAIHQYTLSKQN